MMLTLTRGTPRLVAIVVSGLATCALGLTSGCTMPARVEQMIPEAVQVTHPHPQSVRLVVNRTPQEYPFPASLSSIAGPDFKQALSSAITNSKVFARVVENGEADLELRVDVVDVTHRGGWGMGATMISDWKLTRVQDGKSLFGDQITTFCKKTIGNAFMGNRRVQLVNECVAQENIQEGLQQLSQLKL